MELTQIVAWIGATTGSLALVWDIYKWRHAGPKIDLEARPNMVAYGGLQYSMGTGAKIMVEVTNRGDRPTTLTHLVGYQYASVLHKFLRRKAKRTIIIQDPQTGKIPDKIHPGDRWIGTVDQNEQILGMAADGALYLAVICNHKKRATFKRVIIS